MDPESNTVMWNWDLGPSGHLGDLLPIDWQQPLPPWPESTYVGPDHDGQIVPSDFNNVQGWDTISTDALEVDRILSQVVFPSRCPRP